MWSATIPSSQQSIMPNLYAHYLAAARSLALQADSPLSALITRHRSAYDLGAQGPDIFYYHRAWPWTSGERLGWAADLLHNEKIGEFYQAGVAYIRAAPLWQQETLTAYLCGYAQHHALDACAHPYILYKTGDFTLPGQAGLRSANAHTRFEVVLDTHLLKMETGRRPAWLRSRNLLAVSAEDARLIGDFFEAVMHRVYDRHPASAQVQTAIADARQISVLLLDSGPSPSWLLVQIVARLDRSGRVHSARYRRSAPAGADELNQQHAVWYLPWDNTVPHNASFLDMLDDAAADGQKAAQALAAAIAQVSDPDAAQFDNRSFDTGLDWRQRPQFRFFDRSLR
jgi:hypothetical protein